MKPVVCYICKTWILTQTSQKLVNIFESKVTRRLTAAKREDYQWRIRYKHALDKIFDDLKVSKINKLRKLGQWAAQVQRMNDTRKEEQKDRGQRENLESAGHILLTKMDRISKFRKHRERNRARIRIENGIIISNEYTWLPNTSKMGHCVSITLTNHRSRFEEMCFSFLPVATKAFIAPLLFYTMRF